MRPALITVAVVAGLASGCGPGWAQTTARAYLTDTMSRPSYRAAYEKIASHAKLPKWMASPNELRKATVTPGVEVDVAGITNEVFHACMQHECDSNQLVVMFDTGGSRAVAVYYTPDRKTVLLGNPSAVEQSILYNNLE